MPDMLLTFYCAVADQDAIAEALRSATRAPLHLREERVLGRDFGDAGTPEQVRGALRRAAIDLIVPADDVDALVGSVETARHNHPVRWQTVAVTARGRIA